MNNDNQTAIYDLIQSIQSKMNENDNNSNNTSNSIDNQNETINNVESTSTSTNTNTNTNTNANTNTNTDLASMLNNLDLNSLLSQFQTNSNNNNSNTSNNDGFNIDPNMILRIQKIMSSLNKNDPKKDLLKSLKPFLRKSRQDKISEYITILSLVDAIDLFGSKGSD